MIAVLAASLVASALLAGTADAAGLAGTQWTAERIDGRSVPREYDADLTFRRRAVGGRHWCNTFTGRYRVRSQRRLRFRSLATTAIGCKGIDDPPDFLGALIRTRTYRRARGRLWLKDADGEIVARLVRRRSAA